MQDLEPELWDILKENDEPKVLVSRKTSPPHNYCVYKDKTKQYHLLITKLTFKHS